MSEQYILSLDQGTSSSRAIVFDHDGEIKAVAQQEFRQIFPQPGWVEHHPQEIWTSQASVIAGAIASAGINGLDIAAIGITNQRETTIVWDRETGQPVYNAIVWQDRRTASYCDALKAEGKTEFIREKTGLIIDAYFSATKVKWILDHVEGAREKAEAGKLIFGTVDSWLVWKLTRGEVHITDVTNASRTMLYNIHRLAWDPELLELFGIPAAMLPEVKTSSEIYGHTKTTLFAHKIPIAGIAGDQQAALFGQMCTEPGMVKNTYGTGCFLLMNSGDKPVVSKNNLLATIAWKIGEEVTYALEGSIFVGGAIVQWLRDGLGIIRSSGEVETLAHSVPDAGIELKELRVDGGAAANNVLMQFQADILNATVIRPKIIETTALGAAYLAGLAVGYWSDIHEIRQHWHKEKEFIPSGEQQKMEELKEGWRDAVDRVLER